MVKSSTFHNTWKTFCDSDTIHGLNYIRIAPYPWKLLWQLTFFTMCCISVWLCSKSINRYLLYDVKTALTYDTVAENPFPAITFCNQFSLRRNAILNPTVMMMVETIFADKLEDVSALLSEVRWFERCNELLYSTGVSLPT